MSACVGVGRCMCVRERACGFGYRRVRVWVWEVSCACVGVGKCVCERACGCVNVGVSVGGW